MGATISVFCAEANGNVRRKAHESFHDQIRLISAQSPLFSQNIGPMSEIQDNIGRLRAQLSFDLISNLFYFSCSLFISVCSCCELFTLIIIELEINQLIT